MKLATLAVMASTLAAIAAPALAQPTQEQRAARFDAGDTNHDGKLDKADYLAVQPMKVTVEVDQ